MKRITAILAGIASMTACAPHGSAVQDDRTDDQAHAFGECFGRAMSWRLRIGGTEGKNDSWTVSILEVAPTRYDVSSGHFDDRSVSAAAVIRRGDEIVHLLGERNGSRLCLVDSDLLLGTAASLSVEGFEGRMSALNRGGGAGECRRARLALRGVGEVLFVLSPRCQMVPTIETAAEPCGTMLEPAPVVQRVLQEVGPGNHRMLLTMIEDRSGSHPAVHAGVAAIRPQLRRFEGDVPARCPWRTKRDFAIHIAEALEACGTTLPQAPEGELADSLNQASGLHLDGREWRRLMTDCFGSLERADAALCFLPEMEFTPFVVASTEPGPTLFGTWWLPIDWASACEVHRYRCVALPVPTDGDSRPISLNIWRYPTDRGGPRRFEGEFQLANEVQGPP
jgi:hypothetical protein